MSVPTIQTDLLAAARWLALSRQPGMTPSRLARLFRHFGSVTALLSASAEALLSAGLLPEMSAGLEQSSRQILRQFAAFSEQGMEAIPIESGEYPSDLLDLRVPPVVFFAHGRILPEDARAVAIVETRTPSLEGRRLAREIARRAVAAGFCVVSGLARGIDTEAHRGALQAGGRTLAVLGNGLLHIYPPENKLLAARIRRRGALLSEVWPEATVSRPHLLARDRLQAALSKVVVVVQSHLGCGALTTAKYAVSCRRPLFALSWPEEPFATGLARLRQVGATLLEEADFDDIFRAVASDRGLPESLFQEHTMDSRQ